MSPAQFKRKDIEHRNTRNDAVFVIDNVVYDVTAFLDDHPGGIEVLLDNAGKDASRCFHDIGHSEDAKQWMKRYVIGEVVEEDKLELYRRAIPVDENSSDEMTLSGIVHVWGPPLVLAGLAIVAYTFLFS
ncbi:unnamed protein product [Parnassius mnemosyne]|uniref:Cytochrome b5 n=1 Tax=Parnassius mnemosyne TaxID=213953 RepID=A0AAV1M4I0_9NEOP